MIERTPGADPQGAHAQAQEEDVACHRVGDQDAGVAPGSAHDGDELSRQRRGHGEYDDAEEDVGDADLVDQVGRRVGEDVAAEEDGEKAEHEEANVIRDAVPVIVVAAGHRGERCLRFLYQQVRG